MPPLVRLDLIRHRLAQRNGFGKHRLFVAHRRRERGKFFFVRNDKVAQESVAVGARNAQFFFRVLPAGIDAVEIDARAFFHRAAVFARLHHDAHGETPGDERIFEVFVAAVCRVFHGGQKCGRDLYFRLFGRTDIVRTFLRLQYAGENYFTSFHNTPEIFLVL